MDNTDHYSSVGSVQNKKMNFVNRSPLSVNPGNFDFIHAKLREKGIGAKRGPYGYPENFSKSYKPWAAMFF